MIGNKRSMSQDVEFCINQLVEVAVRALSLGINDPFTAIGCINHLGATLAKLSGDNASPLYIYDENGKLRIITKPLTFDRLMDSAFNQIRQYGKETVAVQIRLLEIIAEIASHTVGANKKSIFRRHANMIKLGCSKDMVREDLIDIEEKYREVIETLKN
ncbi:DUF2254 domain-containing protein [Candidatus Poribacteria bacterium]|nr:DUF2254 domain-containing protein [Candidatus Poribacteria bacterium]